jgi:phenylalanyl-tRNA synthetase beta chain
MLVAINWLRELIAKPLQVADVVKALEAAGIEVESWDKQVIKITTAANRPDLHSLVGVAREVSIHTEASLQESNQKTATLTKADNLFLNQVEDLVPYYSLASFDLDPITKTPAWLQERLELCGVRSVNAIVDITNYVMLETGQPLHAFDAEKVQGKIEVRLAKNSESLVTLDGVSRKLSNKDIVIADSSGVIDLAGIMGGKTTEIDVSTTTILLESANFSAAMVRRSAIRQGLRTEASSRFERSLPVEYAAIGANRALNLLKQVTSLKNLQGQSEGKKHSKKQLIPVSSSHYSRLAGFMLPEKEITSSLNKLSFEYDTTTKPKSILVQPPYWRPDIIETEDVFEEVIKIAGLDQVPATLPLWEPKEFVADRFWSRYWQLREVLRGLGLLEVTTYPFVSEKQLLLLGLNKNHHSRLRNPRSSEQAYLRQNLLPNLTSITSSSKIPFLAVFEIAKVFLPSVAIQPEERLKLGILVTQENSYSVVKNVLDQLEQVLKFEASLQLKDEQPFLHSKKQALIMINKTTTGYIGTLKPDVCREFNFTQGTYMELDLNSLFTSWQDPYLKPIGRFQSVTRDLTVEVKNSTSWQEIKTSLRDLNLGKISYGGEYRRSNQLLHRSVTIRIELTPDQTTLTEADIDRKLSKITDLLKKQFGAIIKQ